MSDTSMHSDITEKNQTMYFFNACLYTCWKHKEPVAFVTIKTYNHFSPLLYESQHWPLKSNRIECSEKLDMNSFFCPDYIYYVNMNQSLFLVFHYLCQGMGSLEVCYFVSDGDDDNRVGHSMTSSHHDENSI